MIRTATLCAQRLPGLARRGLWGAALVAGAGLAGLALGWPDTTLGRVRPPVAAGALGVLPRAPLAVGDAPQQVRIEQHFSIRITPGAPAMPPDVLDALQQQESPAQFATRPAGKCVPIGAIAAVQSAEGNRLLLFLRDTHIISASLERACHAQDFYLGFYVEHNSDGLLCIDRDRLQARTGASCRIKRMKDLAPPRR